jgi:hypothetical protein
MRSLAESALRALALIALGALLWHSFRARDVAPAASARGAGVTTALVRWSTRDAPRRAHVEVASPPSPEMRDWLAALARAGTPVTWGGVAPPPTAVAVEPVPDPQRSSHVWVAGPAATRVVLRDALGVVDSATVAWGGARLVVPRIAGAVQADAAGVEATAAVRDSLVLRPVLVLGQTSWEAKFTLAALEEHGWRVEARLAVAPSGDVTQGQARLAIDTSRYAAIVALDSVARRYASQIVRYVRQGGGLVAVGEAAALASLAPILPAAVTAPASLPGVFTAPADGKSPRAALALAPLGRLKPGGFALETRRGPAGREEIAAAAWRVERGRVVQIGYHDVWRWRLAGAEADPVRAHRAWWAALVSGVAYAPRVPVALTEPLEPTPLASLLATLGPPTDYPAVLASILDDPRLLPLLFGVLLIALLGEWASRRLRGKA